MKSNFRVFLALLLLSVSASGCKKIFDHWFPGHGPHPDPVKCNITRVEQLDVPNPDRRIGLFYYDDEGKLDSVVFDHRLGSKGSQFHYWRYDEQDRLIEYEGDYDYGFFDFIHKYAWNDGRIMRDTLVFNGPGGVETSVYTLFYDNQGRVIKETGIRIGDYNPGEILDSIVYEYGINGNPPLMFGQYDDEPNYLTTNKVLQFTERDYSRNNEAAMVLGYNSYGLPVAFRYDVGNFLQWSHPDKIFYDCTDQER